MWEKLMASTKMQIKELLTLKWWKYKGVRGSKTKICSVFKEWQSSLFTLYCKGNQVRTSQLLRLLHERILQADEITKILSTKGKRIRWLQKWHGYVFVEFDLYKCHFVKKNLALTKLFFFSKPTPPCRTCTLSARMRSRCLLRCRSGIRTTRTACTSQTPPGFTLPFH